MPVLAALVSAVWVHRVPAGSPPYRHRSVPNGSIELLCPVGGSPRFVGPLTRSVTEVLAPGSTVIGLRFRPGAAAGVLGVPAAELADVTVEAGELWGSAARESGERVAAAASDRSAVEALQGLVVGRLADADRPDPLVAEGVRRLMPWRAGEIGPLGAELCVSQRQFRRRCQAAVGVPPKTLHAMLRFQRFLARAQYALSRGASPASEGLAMLAADAGYADQSHLTRECVRLTGVTPRVFLRETEQQCGCGHDHEVSFAPMLRE
jgi:AraC-like DNA-binding protein